MSAYSDPGVKIWVITPSDTTDLTGVRQLRILGGGSLSVRTVGEPDVTKTFDVADGEYVTCRVTRVMAATTATGVVGYGG